MKDGDQLRAGLNEPGLEEGRMKGAEGSVAEGSAPLDLHDRRPSKVRGSSRDEMDGAREQERWRCWCCPSAPGAFF